MISTSTRQCMVIGDPVSQSLSPALHNAGYAALGIDEEFVYVACRVVAGDIESFVAGVRAMGIRGVSCTTPHKEGVMPFLDSVDDVARDVGVVNTIVQEAGQLHGYNTDWIGATAPLLAVTSLKGKRVAVLGAGGAAKAFVYGLVREGAKVTIYNRTESKARALALLFGCEVGALADAAGIQQADVVCNTTTVGMGKLFESPLPAEALGGHQVVFDAVYSPYETKLLRDAKVMGARVVHGTEMLLYQGTAQFELFTGCGAPEASMRRGMMNELARRDG